jgi:hypothetical protein
VDVAGRKPRKTDKGSAFIFVVLLTAAMTTILLAVASLGMASLTSHTRRLHIAQARHAFDGAVARAVADWHGGLYTLPTTRSYTIGGIASDLTITDYSGTIAKTVRIEGELPWKGHTYRFVRIFGKRETPSPWSYALFVQDGASLGTQTLTTGSGGQNGDSYFRLNPSTSVASHTINGDLESASTLTSANFTVLGTLWPNSPSIPFPDVNWENYWAARDATEGTGAVNGYVFPIPFVPTDAFVLFRDGNLNIRGVFTGRGVIFVNGNVNINGAIVYATPGSKLVVIATGNISHGSNASHVGFFYAAGNFDKSEDAGLRTFTGSIVCRSLSLGDSSMTVVNDPYFFDNPAERVRFKLPGHWP